MSESPDTTSAGDAAPQHTNRLIHETSPYLLQHAHNPVDWYAWGPAAWERAKAEDRPVLVSIGYAACHWCHVMERESFENQAIAKRQNELFVSIKVDREERPDIDEIYMETVQVMRGQGGWPLNVFCLPDGRPFFGGTYFPPTRRMNMPSWPQVLEATAKLYGEQKEQILAQAGQLLQQISRRPPTVPAEEVASPSALLKQAAAAIKGSYDGQHGGYGGAPKFPQPTLLGLLLQHAVSHSDAEVRDQVLFTLRKMAEGGMYDQLGGGFHRYSVDAEWLVPHFEKMLYDNALLPPLYLDAARLSGDPWFARIAEETLDYLLRDMRASEGAFYASTDADSEGEEGKYFVWSLDEVTDRLGAEDAALFARYYDVTAQGNFEGQNILHPQISVAGLARAQGASEDETTATLERGREALRRARTQRVPPTTDTKVITSWNGLAIDALARGGSMLPAPRFIAAAESAADFILGTLRRDGGLLRIFAGGRASVPAFLDDYAALADGLLSLYEATGNERWFSAAEELVTEMIAKFWDDDDGGFFTTGSDTEALITRSKPTHDGATPSGNSLAARAMARLYALTSDGTLADRVEAMSVS
ncbi:MAG: thioredoxin domain-containing protein, partial [Dehalococcoidia bacterium]